jgi:hypothetical protein
MNVSAARRIKRGRGQKPADFWKSLPEVDAHPKRKRSVSNAPLLARKKKRSGPIACQSALHRKDKIYCPGVGVAFASGVGEAFGALRASLRASRPVLRASTRVRRRVFFSGEGDGDAVPVAAPLAGLGDGVGSAAKTLESAIRPRIAARRIMRFIIVISGFLQRRFFATEAESARFFSELIDNCSLLRQSSAGFSRLSTGSKQRPVLFTPTSLF